jgi:hypothetical protein
MNLFGGPGDVVKIRSHLTNRLPADFPVRTSRTGHWIRMIHGEREEFQWRPRAAWSSMIRSIRVSSSCTT